MCGRGMLLFGDDLTNIEYEDHRGSYLKCTHSKQSHNVKKWLLHLLLVLLPTDYDCYNQF